MQKKSRRSFGHYSLSDVQDCQQLNITTDGFGAICAALETEPNGIMYFPSDEK